MQAAKDGEPTAPPEPAPGALARTPHWPALDGVRGFILLFVLSHHTKVPGTRGGTYAINVFFVLSAFLITTLLAREYRATGAISLRDFYRRRVLRLFPALICVVAACWLYTRFAGLDQHRGMLEADLPGVCLFFHNWNEVFNPPRSPLLCHLWSLSVEEQFYILWPSVLVVLLALRASPRRIVGVLLCVMAVPVITRPLLMNVSHSYYGTLARLDCLTAGCIVGLLNGWGIEPTRRVQRALSIGAWVAAALLLGHFVFAYRGNYSRYAGDAICTTAITVLIAALAWGRAPVLGAALSFAPLRYFGKISYGTYLWHLLLYSIVGHYWGAPFGKMTGIVLVSGALCVGTVSYYLVERPALRLKSRRKPTTKSATLPMPTTSEPGMKKAA